MQAAMASTTKRSSEYPEPLVFEPTSGQHKTTFIILHGRGSNATKFGFSLLDEPIEGSQHEVSTLRDRYPDAKFVFPSASIRRATVYKRSLISQWFDCWQQTEPEIREDLQIDGLRESTAYIHGLLRKEIDVVGAKNVVLGGLSQGCATVLTSVLLWTGKSVGSIFGMCGWLPFQEALRAVSSLERIEWEAAVGDEPDEDNPFASEDSEAVVNESDIDNGPARALRLLRQEFETPADVEPTCLSHTMPLFIAHGTEDDKVPVTSGRNAAETMREIGVDVTWKEYQRLGHWYSGAMLRDLCKFIDDKPSQENQQ